MVIKKFCFPSSPDPSTDQTKWEKESDDVDQVISTKVKNNHLVDIGCGNGEFLRYSLNSKFYSRVSGIDIDDTALSTSGCQISPGLSNHSDYHYFATKVNNKVLSERIRQTEAAVYKIDFAKPVKFREVVTKVEDHTLETKEASVPGHLIVTLIEVIEHIELDKHKALLMNIFAGLKPDLVIFTTPNKDFNKFFGMKDSEMRHWDHKFEFTEQEFKDYCHRITNTYDYSVDFSQGIRYTDKARIAAVVKKNSNLENLNWEPISATQVAVFSAKTVDLARLRRHNVHSS